MKKILFVLLASCLVPSPLMAKELRVQIQQADGTGPVDAAVVYVDDGSHARPIHAEVIQKDRMFHPHVLILPTGSTVDFPNRDNTQHHVYSFSPSKTFDIELYAGKPEAPVVFDQPGIVELGCNIHDHMQAFIVVADTDAIGQTNANGELTLALDFNAVPLPDTLSLNIWHPRLLNNTRTATYKIDTANLANGAVQTIPVELEPEPRHEGPMDHLQKRFREL